MVAGVVVVPSPPSAGAVVPPVVDPVVEVVDPLVPPPVDEYWLLVIHRVVIR